MAVQLPVTLTPSIFATNGLQQLSSGQVGGMSQVVTMIVDNTTNNVPITVVHGALNEVIQVAANTQATVPTFSGQGYWPWQVLATNGAPAMNLNPTLILLNYERSSGIYRQTSNTIQNTGENSSILYSGIQSPSGNITTTLVAAGPAGSVWVFDSLEIVFEDIQNNVVGLCDCLLQVGVNSAAPIILDTLYGVANIEAANAGIGAFCFPSYRTWPQGLLINNNGNIFMKISNSNNVVGMDIRINLSGYNIPAG